MAVQQEMISLSSCGIEIWATNEISKMAMALGHLPSSICESGHDIPDTLKPSPVYNNNEACICWPHTMKTKQTCCMEMHENSFYE
jgi:hypothetical protein